MLEWFYDDEKYKWIIITVISTGKWVVSKWEDTESECLLFLKGYIRTGEVRQKDIVLITRDDVTIRKARKRDDRIYND